MSIRQIDRRLFLGATLIPALTFAYALSEDQTGPPPESTQAPLWRSLELPERTFAKRVALPPQTGVTRHSETEFSRRLKEAPLTLGSISIGRATRGFLFGGQHMGESPLWELTDPPRAWGTEELVESLKVAIAEVASLHPGAHRLHVGHLSRERGGWLRPHRSHQSGRDVDLGFYYLDDSRWYKNADASNLDVVRTWALLSALLKTTTLEYVFVDRSISELLQQEAHRVGEPQALVKAAFVGDPPRLRPLVRHVRGHRNHLHVRALSPVATENAGRAAARLGRAARRAGGLLNLLRRKQKQSEVRANR